MSAVALPSQVRAMADLPAPLPKLAGRIWEGFVMNLRIAFNLLLRLRVEKAVNDEGRQRVRR